EIGATQLRMLETTRHAKREQRGKRQPNDQAESRPSSRKCLAGGIESSPRPDAQRNGQYHSEPERDRNPFEAVAQQRTRQDHAAVVEIDVGRPDPGSKTTEGVGDRSRQANSGSAVADRRN